MPERAATTGFAEDLRDASKWRVVSAVPVFKPHRRVLPEFEDPTGRVHPEQVIEVTAADLAGIAKATDAAGPQPMTCGHRDPRPDFPEKLQPPVVGWETNHRPGTFELAGKVEPCVLADLCYRAETWDQYGPHEYPFRSVDYDFVEKRLTGLALLRRRPFLDLGVIPYRTGARVAQYAFEGPPMPEAAKDEDKWTPEEEAQYARIMRYMAKKHPRLASCMDGMGGAPAGGTGAGTEPGATNPAGVAGYQAQVSALEQRLALETSRALLAPLKGVVRFDEARELAYMATIAEVQRPAHVQYMLDTYTRLPGGVPAVPVATAAGGPPASGAQPGAMTRAQMEAAVQYQHAQQGKVDWETARLWALANVRA